MGFKGFLFIMFVSLLGVMGCKEEETTYVVVSLDKTITIQVSEEKQLDLSEALLLNNPVTWKSNDETVATVSERGVVKGIKEGKTDVVASVLNQEILFEVVVKPAAEESETDNRKAVVIDLDALPDSKTVAKVVLESDLKGYTHYIFKGKYAKLDISSHGSSLGRTNMEVLDLRGVTDFPLVNTENGLSMPGIPEYCFSGTMDYFWYQHLKEVYLPEEVKILDALSFSYIPSLKEFHAPGVIYLGNIVLYNASLYRAYFPKVKFVSSNSLFCHYLSEVNLPVATNIDYSFLRSSEAALIKLTTSEDIVIENQENSNLMTKDCTLYLHQNKKLGGASIPLVEEGNKWGGLIWKKIIYVDDSGDIVE